MELDVSKYMKIPFQARGRGWGGCDCWGLVWLIKKEMQGEEIPSYLEGYKSPADAEEVEKLIREEKSSWLSIDYPEPYDVILFREGKYEKHCGLFIGNGKFIHCRRGAGTVIEQLSSLTWRQRFVGCYRYAK